MLQRILCLQVIWFLLVQRILRLLVLTLVQSLPLPPGVQSTKRSGRCYKCKQRSSSTGPRPKRRHPLRRNQNKTASIIHSKAIVHSRRTKRSRQPLLSYSLDDLLSKNKKCVAKPITLKEEDPILKAFQENQPEELPELLKADSEDEKKNKKSCLVSSDEVKTEAGKVKVN